MEFVTTRAVRRTMLNGPFSSKIEGPYNGILPKSQVRRTIRKQLLEFYSVILRHFLTEITEQNPFPWECYRARSVSPGKRALVCPMN